MQVKNIEILEVIICLCSLSTTFAGGPKVYVDPNYLNFGEISPGLEVETKHIVVKNEGTSDLFVKPIAISCGCTHILEYNQKIAPGESQKVVFSVDPNHADVGKKAQQAVFSTNDPSKPYIKINIFWTMKQGDVLISPKFLHFECSHRETKILPGIKKSIFVSDQWTSQLKIDKNIKTSSNLSVCTYDILYRCSRGSETHMIRFDVYLRPDMPPGSIDEWFSFKTNHPHYADVKIPITGEIKSSICILPKMLLYRNISPSNKIAVRTIRVQGDQLTEIVEIKDVIASSDWLEISQKRVDKRTIELNVQTHFPKNYKKEMGRILESDIKINFNRPEQVCLPIRVIMMLSELDQNDIGTRLRD